MRSLGGFVLLAGLGVGLFVYLPAPVDRDTTLEQAKQAIARRITTSVARKPAVEAAAPVSRLAAFAPPGIRLEPAARHIYVARAETQSAPALAAPAAKIEAMAWRTDVQPAAAAAAPSGALEPTDPEARYRLVVDIQQQLKRVGCYWGRVNGAWTSNTREAMREFTMHANSPLPVEKPDYLLLQMVKSQPGRSCGAGETADAQAPAAAPSTAAATVEKLPWKAAAAPATRVYTPLPNSVVTSEPLPGRMAIGGPLPAAQEPLIPGGNAGANRGVATAALDPAEAAGPQAPRAPAAAPRPRQAKKSSGSSRTAKPGTPRYNLMLSLGGVY